MGHHGSREPYSEMNSEQFADLLKSPENPRLHELLKKKDPNKLGGTGEFPMGKLNNDDEGEIRIGITKSNGKVIIDFGKPVHWIGFSPEQAKQVAESLLRNSE